MKHSIWKTPEAEAWCRDLCYYDYVNVVCKHMNIVPRSEEFYNAICKVFEDELEREIELIDCEGDEWHMKKDEV